MDPVKKVPSPEKLAEIEARILKSKEKYQLLNQKNGPDQEKQKAILKEGRIFLHKNWDKIFLFDTYNLGNTKLAAMEFTPEVEEEDQEFTNYEPFRFFYAASATTSKREEHSERIAKGLLGYRLKKYIEEPYDTENPFAGQFVIGRSIIGSRPLWLEYKYIKDGETFKSYFINPQAYKILEKITDAYFVSQYAAGEDMDGGRLPSTLIRALKK